MAHTKGIWWNDGLEIGSDPFMSVKIAFVSGENYEEAAENARRIVACVNACDGLSTKDIETYAQEITAHFSQQSEVEKLCEVGNELLLAAKRYADRYCVDGAEDPETCSPEQHEDAKALFAAIKGAEANA